MIEIGDRVAVMAEIGILAVGIVRSVPNAIGTFYSVDLGDGRYVMVPANGAMLTVGNTEIEPRRVAYGVIVTGSDGA